MDYPHRFEENCEAEQYIAVVNLTNAVIDLTDRFICASIC